MSDQEREIRVTLLDGSEVIMNTGDRVLFQASRAGAIPLTVDADTIADDLLKALEEAQQQLVSKNDELTETENEAEKYQVESSVWEERYTNISSAYRDLDISAGETLELLHETSRSLAEAQQTIATLQSESKRLSSLLSVLKDATELMSWRDPGGGKGQEGALKLIYKWLDENPSPEYLAASRNKEGPTHYE